MENTNVHNITVTINSVQEIAIMGADNSMYSKKLVIGGKDKYSQLETRFELKFDESATAAVFWNKMASIIARKARSEANMESTYIYDVEETIQTIEQWRVKAEQWDDQIAAEMAANPSENPPF